MNPFTFQVPSNILFETGASKKVADLAAEFGAQRILLVTDKGVRDAGLTRAPRRLCRRPAATLSCSRTWWPTRHRT